MYHLFEVYHQETPASYCTAGIKTLPPTDSDVEEKHKDFVVSLCLQTLQIKLLFVIVSSR